MLEWQDLKNLDISYKNLINNYFDKTGKFKIEKNILYVDFDNWGIEKFCILNIPNKNFYSVEYEDFDNIYNTALSIQIGNWETFLKMEPYINNSIITDINIYFIIISEICNDQRIKYLKKIYKNISIIKTENRGMDIGLFLTNLHYIKYKNYNHDFIIKIHTKTDDNFRNSTLKNLFGTHRILKKNIQKLQNESIGIISGYRIHKFNESTEYFHSNIHYLNIFVKHLYHCNVENDKLEFVHGTFFIAKMKIFEILNLKKIEYLYDKLNIRTSLDYYWYSTYYNLDINNRKSIFQHYINDTKNRYANNLDYQSKTNKLGLRDNMVEHSLERLFGYICKKSNYSIENHI